MLELILGALIFVIIRVCIIEGKIDKFMEVRKTVVVDLEPKVICPSCDSVNSIVPCEEVIDGINHTNLDTHGCLICGHTLITDDTKINIVHITERHEYVDDIVLCNVRSIILNCANPDVNIVKAFSQINNSKDALRAYSSDVVRRAMLRSEPELFVRVYNEIDEELRSGFPECFVREAESK